MAAEFPRLTDRLRDTALVRQAWFTARSVSRDRPEASGSPHVAFEVVEGIHAGARLDLAEATFTVGSSTDADIVLSDPGIAGIHARLRVAAGRVEMEALAGSVTMADGALVPEGHGRRCKLPVEATLGEARVRLAPLEPLQQVKTVLFDRPLMVVIGLFAVVFGLSITWNTLSQAEPDGPARAAGLDGGLANLSLASASMQDAALPQTATPVALKALQDLRSHVRQAGLDGLSTEAVEGRLVVSGTVSRQQGETWKDIRSWFDRSHGERVPLVSDVTSGDASQTPRLSLQAIWYGERPYVIAADGQRYHEGAFVSGGWTIKEIGSEQLLLSKDGTSVALKYR
jgi:hypothetical protein